jgi:hypothetical protein
MALKIKRSIKIVHNVNENSQLFVATKDYSNFPFSKLWNIEVSVEELTQEKLQRDPSPQFLF